VKLVPLVVAGLLGGVAVGAFPIAKPTIGTAVRETVTSALQDDSSATHKLASYADAVSITDLHEGGVSHFLGPTISVRTNRAGEAVELSLIVDTDGKVVSATRKSGPKEFYVEAERLARTVRFMPFRRGGIPVAAKIDPFFVPIYPPERRPDYPVAFPNVKNWDSLVISMTRGPAGGGFVTQVEIRANGTVTYDGWMGSHRASIPSARVKVLVDQMRRHGFFWLHDSYASSWSDQASATIRVSFDGRTKTVVDYAGRDDGMPDAVIDIERAIDQAVDVDRWEKGNSETGPSLAAENWDFKARNYANSVMLAMVARRGSVGALRDLIALGAPLDAGALVAAAKRGEPEMLGVLLDQPSKWSAAALGEALVAAAEKPNKEMVLTLLWQNADPRYQNGKEWYSKTPLMAACNAGSQEVTEFLLRWVSKRMGTSNKIPVDAEISPAELSAFVNLRDINGKTALFWAIDGKWEPEGAPKSDRRRLVQTLMKAGALISARDKEGNTPLIVSSLYPGITADLIAAGAKVNARNKGGRTALMESFVSANTLTLLQAGADPHLKDNEGRTALELSMEYGGRETTTVLREWLEDHPPPASK
jgi:ankyrin repeat protein